MHWRRVWAPWLLFMVLEFSCNRFDCVFPQRVRLWALRSWTAEVEPATVSRPSLWFPNNHVVDIPAVKAELHGCIV